jgi:lysozyme family protein
MTIDRLIDGVIGREGSYSNNPNDSGGETMWGVTARVARANGYTGPMRDMPRDTARNIYFSQYVQKPGFAAVMAVNEPIAEELVDTGVNMGPGVAALFLQQVLNGLNSQGHDYADIQEDADVGPGTINALKVFLAKRGAEGETIMLKALNCLQGARYIELARTRSANESFLYGWLRTRVAL